MGFTIYDRSTRPLSDAEADAILRLPRVANRGERGSGASRSASSPATTMGACSEKVPGGTVCQLSRIREARRHPAEGTMGQGVYRVRREDERGDGSRDSGQGRGRLPAI